MAYSALVRVVVMAAVVAIAGCYVAPGRGGHYGYSSWDVVRNDPCRYEEYRRFAERHKNPNKRQQFVERLAREGCSLDREYDRDEAREYDRAWDIVRGDPCRYEEYRRYADRHDNPEKRRRFVEQLARDGCSLDRRDSRYDHRRDDRYPY